LRKFAAYLAIGFALVAFQSIIKRILGVQSGPELLFILVVFSGVYHKPFGGLILAFIFGFVTDALWGLLPGMYAALYTMSFALCRVAGRRFHMRSAVFQILIVLVMTLAAKLAEMTFLGSVEARLDFSWSLYLSIWRPLVWNTLFAVPVVAFLERFERLFGDEYASQFLEKRGIL
jgi:rod shape-determining protein MreD